MEQMNNENNFDNVVEPVNNVAQENYTQQEFSQTDSSQGDNKDSKDTLSITSLILGIVGFLVNPLYIVSVLAIIFGAIGMNSNGVHKDKGKIGMILGIIAICVQVVVDFILTILTAGAGGVSFCC